MFYQNQIFITIIPESRKGYCSQISSHKKGRLGRRGRSHFQWRPCLSPQEWIFARYECRDCEGKPPVFCICFRCTPETSPTQTSQPTLSPSLSSLFSSLASSFNFSVRLSVCNYDHVIALCLEKQKTSVVFLMVSCYVSFRVVVSLSILFLFARFRLHIWTKSHPFLYKQACWSSNEN